MDRETFTYQTPPQEKKEETKTHKKGINKQPGAATMLTASITPGATQQGFPPEMQRFRELQRQLAFCKHGQAH